ncbi:MAG: hypothetical protein RMK19_05440 [Bacteroidia bacterium]|nr:FixH family protein [Bacteroidia bacterium]MDW8015437.1 hypothetical protein [Bacteroidia bacterium]
MLRLKRARWIGFILTVAGFVACKKKEEKPKSPSGSGSSSVQLMWVELGHAHDREDKYHADLYVEMPVGQNQLTEGYFRFRVKIKRGHESTAPLYTGRDVQFIPIMYMESGAHSCPVEQPEAPAQDGFYYGAAFFMMPSMPNEPWKFHVLVGQDTITFNLTVVSHPFGWVRRGRRFGTPPSPYLYEMKLLNRGVGVQEVSFYIYKRDMSQPMTEPRGFPPATNITQVDIQTWMPSMGHDGGPGGQPARPVPGKPGRFDGKAAFNMSGDWWVIATFKEGENAIGRDTFALEF